MNFRVFISVDSCDFVDRTKGKIHEVHELDTKLVVSEIAGNPSTDDAIYSKSQRTPLV